MPGSCFSELCFRAPQREQPVRDLRWSWGIAQWAIELLSQAEEARSSEESISEKCKSKTEIMTPTRASNDPWRISFSAAAVVFVSMLNCEESATFLYFPVCCCPLHSSFALCVSVSDENVEWCLSHDLSLSPDDFVAFRRSTNSRNQQIAPQRKKEARIQFNSPPPAFDFLFASLKVLHFFPSVELSRSANKTRPTIFSVLLPFTSSHREWTFRICVSARICHRSDVLFPHFHRKIAFSVCPANFTDCWMKNSYRSAGSLFTMEICSLSSICACRFWVVDWECFQWFSALFAPVVCMGPVVVEHRNTKMINRRIYNGAKCICAPIWMSKLH